MKKHHKKPADAPRRGKRLDASALSVDRAIGDTIRELRGETPAPTPAPQPVAPAPAITSSPTRAALSPAARRGMEAVRYIRIHLRKPYGTRGQEGIVNIAREAAHLALQELADNAAVPA